MDLGEGFSCLSFGRAGSLLGRHLAGRDTIENLLPDSEVPRIRELEIYPIEVESSLLGLLVMAIGTMCFKVRDWI